MLGERMSEEPARTRCGWAVVLMVVLGLCSCLTPSLLQELPNPVSDVR